MNLTTYRTYIRSAFVAVILSVPLALVLPVEVSFENGIIENAQVIVLLAGAILMLRVRSRMKWFQIFFAMGLVLMALRELSWGRVFFPIDFEELGAVFVTMAEYKYRVHVYAFLVVYISAMIFILIRFVPIKKILRGRQPIAAFAVMILAIAFNYIGEHGFFIGKACGQILEELNELIFYVTLIVAGLYYCNDNNF